MNQSLFKKIWLRLWLYMPVVLVFLPESVSNERVSFVNYAYGIAAMPSFIMYIVFISESYNLGNKSTQNNTPVVRENLISYTIRIFDLFVIPTFVAWISFGIHAGIRSISEIPNRFYFILVFAICWFAASMLGFFAFGYFRAWLAGGQTRSN